MTTMIAVLMTMTMALTAFGQTVNWCAVSGKERDGVTELQKCESMVGVLNAQPGVASGTYGCVESEDCEASVRDGSAHAYTMDGGGIFSSRTWGGVPLAAESTSTTSASATYYTVAVVKNGFCTETVSLASLRGARSCHTGYRKSAGWRFPLTTLMKSGLASLPGTQDCARANDVEVLESFFSSACAPGTVKDSPLCSNCAGARNPLDVEGEAWCKKDVDPYAGYGGAFKCLAADAGDVAFVKHTTVASESSEPWFAAANHRTSEFKLLCRGGGCAEVGDWANCYWAKVPAHAVIVNVNTLGYTLRAQLNADLLAASVTPAFAALFYTPPGGVNPNPGSLVFKSGTQALVDTLGQDIREYFGDTYENYEFIDVLEDSTANTCAAGGGAAAASGGAPGRARRQGRRQGRRADGRGDCRGRLPRRAHALCVLHDWQGAQRAADVHEDLGGGARGGHSNVVGICTWWKRGV